MSDNELNNREYYTGTVFININIDAPMQYTIKDLPIFIKAKQYT